MMTPLSQPISTATKVDLVIAVKGEEDTTTTGATTKDLDKTLPIQTFSLARTLKIPIKEDPVAKFANRTGHTALDCYHRMAFSY